MQRIISLSLPILGVLFLLSCTKDKIVTANKGTAQNTLTVINNTGHPLFMNFRAHDVNNTVASLNSNTVSIAAQTTVTYNSPADLNANPGWNGIYSQYYTAPGDWDGVKGGFADIGQGWEIGNYQPGYLVDSVWSLYYPQINATMHATWKHVNGGYEFKAY